MSPAASVVIPAYNEGRVIARCLEALTGPAAQALGGLEIVVAVNGTTDDTAEVARRYPGVTVLDLPTAGKVGALNAGDAAATVFPRIYLDADIVLSDDALPALVDVLTTDEARAAAPRVRFATDGSDAFVRAFYRVYEELPYVRSGLIGLGLYGLSAAGRARFGQFPDIQADDLFIQRLFRPEERVTTAGTFTVQAPRDLANLLKVRTRIARGNAEFGAAASTGEVAATDAGSTSGSTMKALATLAARRPALAPAAAVYAAVGMLARRRAARGPVVWDRDDSTR